MSTGIAETLAYVVEQLADAEIAAAHTTADLPFPGAWVHATRYERITFGGGARITVTVDLVAEGHDEHTALAQLEDMLDRALTVITPTAPIETDVAIELSPEVALPAFRIITTLEYTKD